MKVIIPAFIKEEGQILMISRDKKENPWNHQEYEEDRICYPYYIHWVETGSNKEKLTEISCLSSRRFGGNCECINHGAYFTYTKGENVDDNVFTDLVSGIEWEEEYDGGIVSPKFGCPQCGNRNMDSLIINDDNDYCICHECGLVYDPISQEVKQK